MDNSVAIPEESDSEEIEVQTAHAGCLVFDDENIEGFLLMDADFMALDGLARADVLKDWIYDLQGLYLAAVKDIFPDHMKEINH